MTDIDDDTFDESDEDAPGTDGAPVEVQDAIDRIVDRVYSKPARDPEDRDVEALSSWFDETGRFFEYHNYGHYVPTHMVEWSARGGDYADLYDDVSEDRYMELEAGAEPTEAELEPWRARVVADCFDDPAKHELPVYHTGCIESRDGQEAVWLAVVEGFIDPFLEGRIVGIASSDEPLLQRLKEKEDAYAVEPTESG